MGTVHGWARGLLLGESLGDKLEPAVDLVDRPSEPILVPDAPGRPAGLRFATERREVPRGLASDADRIEILHALANHELLAIETMALVLLRFPDAPTGFRSGLVATIGEEQRHLGMYRARLNAIGAELGDRPVSGYFWSVLAQAGSPRAFVARMSLGFEQANLDFAALWADRFAAAGDSATAAVLRVVLRDEIGHVRHGAAWFDRWRDGDWWTAWEAELEAPLTPARARGPIYRREERIAAGLPLDVIDRLEVYSASKGRPPRVFAFDPGAEEDLAGVYTTTRDAVRADLEHVVMWLAGRDDAVLGAKPDPEWLRTLVAGGTVLPQFVQELPEPNGGIVPWAWTPRTCKLYGRAWDERWRAAWSKEWTAQACHGWDEIAARLVDRPMVLKAPYSTAGRDRAHWPGDVQRWAEGCLARQGAVIVEPWLDRVMDLSVQIEVGDTVRIVGMGRFLTDSRGAYRGAVLGRLSAGLTGELARFLVDAAVEERMRAAAERVGERLRAIGFAGPAGIDAFVYREDGLHLREIVEVNPRMTMGRVALALGERVRGSAVWVHTRPRPGLAEAVEAVGMKAEGGKMIDGAICTTDARRARFVATVLLVGSWTRIAELADALRLPIGA